MAENRNQNKLLPSLLDRLTDNKRSDSVESREQRAASLQSLRRAVIRDLEWLMNTVNLESSISLNNHPQLRDTVINYGLPGLAGYTIRHDDRLLIQKLIKSAIQAFEPRIMKNTVRVSLIEEADVQNAHSIAFEIEGALWGEPVPEPLYIRTELDLELGDVKVTEL